MIYMKNGRVCLPIIVVDHHCSAIRDSVYAHIRDCKKQIERDNGVKLIDQTMNIETHEENDIERLANEEAVVYNFSWKIAKAEPHGKLSYRQRRDNLRSGDSQSA